MSKKIDRTGEENINKYGSKMEVIKYKNNLNMLVRFENGWETECGYDQFKKGGLLSPYDKSVYHVGYLGEGDYKANNNGVHTKEYNTWKDMLYRCYTEKSRNKVPTYKECTVCEEWLCFQNFAKWFYENYYQIDGQVMCLDKDILHKGNKVYSPDNCVFAPKSINSLFVKCDKARGKLPVGVCFDKEKNKYVSNGAGIDKMKRKFLGRFNTPEDAFYLGYKPAKEKHIKEVAEEYKDQIPERLYNAMINYKVEITD